MHDIDNPLNELLDEVMDDPQREDEAEYENEADLASELLASSSEGEVDQFFDKLVSKAVPMAKRFLRSSAGKTLTGALKGLARKTLSSAGAAAGNMIVPGLGGAVGGQLASGLGSAFGLELEGMPAEEAEMEVARRVVRVGRQTAAQVARDPQAATNPTQAVRRAMSVSVQRHLPSLANGTSNGATATGRWVRRGNRIVIIGA